MLSHIVASVLGIGVGYIFSPLIKASLEKLFRKNG